MKTYRELELGASGIKYVNECLESGNTLAKLLLDTQDLRAGRVLTRLPAGVDEATARDFSSGGKLPDLYPRTGNLQPVTNTDHLLVEEIRDFLAAMHSNLCIFEDASARATDPLVSLQTRYSIFEGEIYHLLCPPTLKDEEISNTIGTARSWLLIGALTSVPEEFGDLCSKEILTWEGLSELAQRTTKIIVGAYDGEGYVTWNKL